MPAVDRPRPRAFTRLTVAKVAHAGRADLQIVRGYRISHPRTPRNSRTWSPSKRRHGRLRHDASAIRDTVSFRASSEDGPCHVAILRRRLCLAELADHTGRRPGCLAQRMPGDGAMRRRAPRRSAFAGWLRRPTRSRSPMPAIRPITSTRPGGVRIATDYSGAYRTGRLPDVVTMNRAHSTHYTLFPDPQHSACAARLGR